MGKKTASAPFLRRPPACLADETTDTKKLEDEARAIQTRLKELFTQLWDENATFQRIMYKNQNQHRRTLYYRRLTQVRRDLLLLHTMRLSEAADCLSPSKPPKSQKMSREEVQRRLLGGARLLQLMADPVLAAGAAIEGLLSQSFFMPFALTVLAMLARLRALLVQGLYEVVAAFNLVAASLRQMEIASDAPLFLECTWDGVKLAFSEKPRPIPELVPLPKDATSLPDVGWFIDDRSALAREKLRVKSEPEPVIYERGEGFILEDSQFALLGEEEEDVATQEMPTLGEVDVKKEMAAHVKREMAMDMKKEMAMDVKKEMAMDVVSTPILSKEVQDSLKERLSKEAKAELESWKAELESWGSEGVEKSVEESRVSAKKRVAYVSVQIGGAKVPKTEHPL